MTMINKGKYKMEEHIYWIVQFVVIILLFLMKI